MKESSQKNKIIYLADLTYDTTVIALEHFPISVGYIAAYINQQFPGTFEIQIFKFPGLLFDAIDKCLPDILAVSHFPWNKNLGIYIADYYSSRKTNGFVVFGGGEFSFEKEKQVSFFDKHKMVDMFVMYDGEFGFEKLLEKYIKYNGEKKDILDGQSIDGCVYWHRKQKKLLTGNCTKRPDAIDDVIPSPYLTGLMDPFFNNPLLTPMIQSTRGCPFTCTYCWAGNKYNRHVRHFSTERVISELEYIASFRKNSTNKLLTFSNANFGMYQQDEIIAEKIVDLQEKYGFPASFYTPCGKDNKKRVFRIIKKIKNAAAIVSVQSTDSTVLKNVNRSVFKIEEYKSIVDLFHTEGIPVETEIIAGMPGETKQTHLQTIRDLIHMGLDEIHPFTLMLLNGTVLSTDDSQNKHQWDKRFRILPRNFGKYRGKICFETEIIAVGSTTYTFDDYLYWRGLHGVLRIIFNYAFFSDFIQYLKENKVDMFEFCLAFYSSVKDSKGLAGEQFRSFLREAHEEIWNTEEELYTYYLQEQNYQKLLTGEKGENLLGKYKVITVCEHFDAWCDFFYTESVNFLSSNKTLIDNIKSELSCIKDHIMGKAFNILSDETVKGKTIERTIQYDIVKWQKEKNKPLSEYKFSQPITVIYESDEESKRTISEILTLHQKGKSDLWKAVGSRYYLPALFRKPYYTMRQTEYND